MTSKLLRGSSFGMKLAILSLILLQTVDRAQAESAREMSGGVSAKVFECSLNPLLGVLPGGSGESEPVGFGAVTIRTNSNGRSTWVAKFEVQGKPQSSNGVVLKTMPIELSDLTNDSVMAAMAIGAGISPEHFSQIEKASIRELSAEGEDFIVTFYGQNGSNLGAMAKVGDFGGKCHLGKSPIP